MVAAEFSPLSAPAPTINAKDYLLKKAPPTMYYIPDYVSQEQEAYLVRKAHEAPEFCWGVSEGRRVQNYGQLPPAATDDEGKAAICSPMPQWLDELIDRLMTVQNCYGEHDRPDFIRVNTYEPGQGVSPHRDIQTNVAATSVITLGSGTLLDFYDAERLVGSVWLEPRSLLLFSDDAFSRLRHGIRRQSEDVITERVFNRTEAHLPVGTVIPRRQRVSLASYYNGK
jgi:alkylated DNA repair protein alkB family protein 6